MSESPRSPAIPHAAPRASAEPNVIPMIDILLVLLIIFMAAIMKEWLPHSPLQLPQPAPADGPAEPAIVLEVAPGGVFRLNREPVAGAELEARLRSVYAGRPRKVLIVKGDPAVSYQQVMSAVDVARRAGVKVIGVAPKDPPRAP